MGLCPLLTATPLPGSEFQVQAPSRGSLGRGYVGGRSSEKHSPDSACSVDYSNSRLSSPEHPNEGEALALVWTGGGAPGDCRLQGCSRCFSPARSQTRRARSP